MDDKPVREAAAPVALVLFTVDTASVMADRNALAPSEICSGVGAATAGLKPYFYPQVLERK